MAARDRRKAETSGRRAEWVAGLALTLKGFRIIARRYKTPAGEIDLVARRGGLLIFVEVKARERLEDAIEAVTQGNWRRVNKAAGLFLSRHPHLATQDMRYDIIALGRWRLRHIIDAWRPDE